MVLLLKQYTHLGWDVLQPISFSMVQQVKEVKDLIPRKGQPTGIGRVIRGSEWLNRIA
jgi:hypothetical protein